MIVAIKIFSLQEVTSALEQFDHYRPIWELDREKDLEQFLKDDPRLSEFEAKIRYHEQLENEITNEPEYYDVGPIALYTGQQFQAYLFVHERVSYQPITINCSVFMHGYVRRPTPDTSHDWQKIFSFLQLWPHGLWCEIMQPFRHEKRYETWSIFGWSKYGLNSKFSFS